MYSFPSWTVYVVVPHLWALLQNCQVLGEYFPSGTLRVLEKGVWADYIPSVKLHKMFFLLYPNDAVMSVVLPCRLNH